MSTATHPEVVDRILAFYRREATGALAQLAESYPMETTTITIDWHALARFDRRLAEDFLDQPEWMRPLAEEALAQYDYPVDVEIDADRVTVRLANLPEGVTHAVGNYSPTDVAGTMRSVRGQVSQITQPDSLMSKAGFECQRCGHITTVPQTPDSWQEPHQCESCERDGPFKINFTESELIDHQMVRLQTPPEQVTEGGTDTIDLQVRGDVVGSVKPGERVIANAELDLRQSSSGREKRPTFEPYGDADSFQHLERDLDDVSVEEHREEFEEIANSGEAIEEIIASIAPSIYGYDHIKEAIAYQLFGGVRKEAPDGSTRRGSPHMLMVGDPGLGKSQLIHYAAKLAPRSIYTSGQQTTKAGLTASAVQDDFGDGGWTIKTGALVQAHRGLAGIDELDKMSDEDRSGLLEAMESQTISKSAAGENVTLPAQTTVLAGANPIDGRFNQHQNLGEQVDLHPALFSRFDLIFTMKDHRDAERDMQIADRIATTARVGQQLARDEDPEDGAEVTPTIEQDVLRAYIAYARQEIVPTLTEEAEDVIKQRYAKIRNATDDDGPVPTTPRSIEAMIRLAETKARTRLSEEITAEDARRVCNMVELALEDVGVDPETGELDTDIIESGKSHTQRQRIQQTHAIISDLKSDHDYGVPLEEVRELYRERGLDEDKFDRTIKNLRDRGEIYEPNSGEVSTT